VFRLFDTTRAYAIEQLDESAESERIAHRHAEYYRELLETAATGAAAGNLAAGFAAEIDNLRAALVWAFSDGGNPSIAIALASASAQLLLELSLLGECQNWTSKALALLSPEENGTRREMVLQVAFAISFRFMTGATEEVHSRLTRALELAEQFNDADYKLRILHVHCSYYAWRGDLRAALAIARQCEAFAASVTDLYAQPIADRLLGIVQFYLGDLTSARAHLERALDRFPSVPRRNDLLRFGADQRLVALSHKSDILWLQGLADQALQLARSSLDEARTLGHPLALCNALVSLAIISIRVGDIEKSASWIEKLRDQAEKDAVNAYNICAVGLAGQLSAMRNDNATAVRLLRAALDRSPRGSFTYYALYTMFAADLAFVEGKTGDVGSGLAVIDETLQRIERNEEWWHLPETLRIKGELLLLQSEPGAAAAAEDHFRQALDRASQQGALSWELRAATSLARLLRNQGRPADAIACLQPVYDRFTEGFGTVDLIAAKQLLDELCDAHLD
jgi:predicted ATPase